MAVEVLTDFSAALSLVYGPGLTDQINRVSVLPQLLPVVPGSGKAVYGTCQFTGAANAVAATEGAARDSSDADAEHEAPRTLPWATYDKTVSVSDLAVAATASNMNPGSAGALGGSLLAGRLRDQNSRLALGIATDAYAGDPTASPAELAGAALAIDSSGTFASINPGTYSEWASVEDTAALASMTESTIRTWLTDVYDACGYYPEFVTCPTNVFNAIRDLFNDRQSESRVIEVSLARGGGPMGDQPRTVKLSVGNRAVEVDGVPFILDKYSTADTMYSWNTEFVEIQQLNPFAGVFEQTPAGILDLFRRLTDNPKLQLPREQIEGMAARSLGLRPYVKMLGARGLSTEAVVHVMAQFDWKRRNTFGKFTWT